MKLQFAEQTNCSKMKFAATRTAMMISSDLSRISPRINFTPIKRIELRLNKLFLPTIYKI